MFSENAIIQALNFNEQSRFHGFCALSIHIHVVNFDPRANLARTYEENRYMLYLWITKEYYYEIRGENTWERYTCKLYVRGGVGVVADYKSKDRGSSN